METVINPYILLPFQVRGGVKRGVICRLSPRLRRPVRQARRPRLVPRGPAKELLLEAEHRHSREHGQEIEGDVRSHQHLHGGRHEAD